MKNNKKSIIQRIEEAKFSLLFNEQFIAIAYQHFSKRLANLKILMDLRESGHDLEIEIIILVGCFIDSFASIFYQCKTDARFRKILYEISSPITHDFNKVSLIELERLINGDKKLLVLKKAYGVYLKNKIDFIDYAQISNSMNFDPLREELINELLRIKEVDNDLLKEAVEMSTHASILYKKYRCASVHDCQVSQHWDVTNGDNIYYLGIIGERANIIFPVKFLVRLPERILTEVAKIIEGKIGKKIF